MSLPGIVLCSAGDGSVTRMVEAHTAPVNALVFTSSAALLVSASEDRTIVVTDTASGRLVELLTAHTTGVRCLALSSDGSRLLSIPSEGAAKLWSTTDWKEMARIDVGEPIDTACCAPDGGWVLLGGSFGLRLWKMANSPNRCRGWWISPQFLLRQMDNWSWWALRTDRFGYSVRMSGLPLRTLPLHPVAVTALAFSGAGNRLVAAAKDGRVRIFFLDPVIAAAARLPARRRTVERTP
jgi:WD40 repeat protein